MLYRRFRFRHVCQSLWHCVETISRGQQPIHARVHVRFLNRHRVLHSYPDELFQQGFEPVFDIDVGHLGKQE